MREEEKSQFDQLGQKTNWGSRGERKQHSNTSLCSRTCQERVGSIIHPNFDNQISQDI